MSVCFATRGESQQVFIEDDSQTPIQVLGDSLLDPRNYDVLARKQMIPAELGPKLMQARGLMRSDDYVNATAILELLHQEYPLDPRVSILLKDCYVERKLYISAVELLQSRLRREPFRPELYVELADVYFKAERPDSAVMQVNYTLGIPRNLAEIVTHQKSLRLALNLLMDHGRDSVVLSSVADLREVGKDTTLFADVAAKSRERLRDFSGAIRESFVLMKDDTGVVHLNVRTADRQLAQLIAYPDAKADVESTLRELTRKHPDDTLYVKYLGEFYVKYDRFDDGFDLFTRFDSLTHNEGRQLMFYMRERFDRRAFVEAARIGEHIMRRYPSSPFAVSIQFYLGRSQAETGQYQTALATFAHLRETTPVLGDRLDALLLSGDVYFDRLQNVDSAAAYYQEIIGLVTGGEVYQNAQFRLWQIDLIHGNMDAARNRLDLIEAANPLEDNAERLAFCRARMELFAAKRDSAEVGFKRLIERYPKGLYVNDALENMLILQTTSEASPELFGLYATAELLRERRQVDSLVSALKSIAENDDTALADLALLRMGQLYLGRGDTTSALVAFNETVGRFPETYFAPYANKLKGDIYFNDPERRTEALAIYRSLLKQFGSYPFAAEVRQRLKDAGQPDAPASAHEGKSST